MTDDPVYGHNADARGTECRQCETWPDGAPLHWQTPGKCKKYILEE